MPKLSVLLRVAQVGLRSEMAVQRKKEAGHNRPAEETLRLRVSHFQ
jgi:hypothetical protein